ncbi:MAG: PQQ-dependent dehydrogenase, methanol/ethanol family [Maricaulaceae bacterium]|jgi:PQQ-dependent dehydrogenase (methanol/ethanol family)
MSGTTRLLCALAGASALVLAACSETDVEEAAAPAVEPAEVAAAEPAAESAAEPAPAPEPEPAASEYAQVDGARIAAADAEPGAWLSHGRTYSEQRFSPLDQINTDNVDELSLSWFFELGTTRGVEATPIVVDGVMYATSAWSIVYALNPLTGELLWEYDPEVPRDWGVYACCDVVNRGVAVWEGKVFVGTIDGRLIGLDAATGDELWSVDTIAATPPYTITGAPRVVNGKVIIGNGGAEYGVRGYVTAYDAETGEQAWRFYTVPGNPAGGFEDPAMEAAAATWTGEWWEYGGGGTVWDSMAYDPELNLLYIGVGNGSPWNREIRSPEGGDNLYLSSIVALNPDTGEYVWHYQTTPGETWDYTATQHIIVADLEVDGAERRVVMQAPKNGFFYVLDAATGEFISADNYVPVNWATGVDPETGRPIEVPESRYLDSPFQSIPGPLGGHNWQPMSFSPETGLVYISTHQVPFDYAAADEIDFDSGRWNLGLDLMAVPFPSPDALAAAIRSALQGHLLAWDPVAQEEAWRIDLGGPWNGGVLSTAGGLVFQGTAQAEFKAYDAASGEALWSFPAQTGVIAPPMTYEIDGVQYLTVLAGYGGAFPLTTAGNLVDEAARPNLSRVLTFTLDGGTELPPLETVEARLPEPPAITAGEDVIVAGGTSYQYYCSVCHGVFAWSGGQITDLRTSPALADANAWKAIVHDGAAAGIGMAAFEGYLDEDEVEAIRQYVIFEATNAYAAQEAAAP